MTAGLTTTTGLINSTISVDCYEVVKHYEIDPNAHFLLRKDGLHCEPCHYFQNSPHKTTIGERTYEICCAVNWALEQIRHDC